MAEPYRRSFRELVTRYEFEPQLRDLYVEGERDRFLLGWFFRGSHCNEVAIYPILSVEVPRELLEQLRVFGNQGRVIALCKYLEEHLSVEARNVLGLIDKDTTEFLGKPIRLRYLVTTDFACLECYALSESTMDKFCRLYLGKLIEPDRMSELLNILVELFVLRAAKQVVASGAHWIDDFTRYCAVTGGKLYFDRETFVERLANASEGQLSKDALVAQFTELLQERPRDIRQAINGHDLVRMLSWFAHEIGVPSPIYDAAPLHRALITSIELEELNATPLFVKLVEWAKRT